MKDTLNLASVMIGTMKLVDLKEFYKKILMRTPDWEMEGWAGWQIGNGQLTVGEHSKMGGETKDPGRVMFNLETEEVKAEYERMKKEGAKVVATPYEMEGMWIATLADPDGNYFQLMSPMKNK